jgi:hypothetical protein
LIQLGANSRDILIESRRHLSCEVLRRGRGGMPSRMHLPG